MEYFFDKTTVKLGYNELYGTGKIRSLKPGFVITGIDYNQEAIGPSTKIDVKYCFCSQFR